MKNENTEVMSESCEDIIIEHNLSAYNTDIVEISKISNTLKNTKKTNIHCYVLDFLESESSNFSLSDSLIENHTNDLNFSFGNYDDKKSYLIQNLNNMLN